MTWELLEELTGRPGRTMHRHDKIYDAYTTAKDAQSRRRIAEKAGRRVRAVNPARTEEGRRIIDLEKAIAHANDLIARYDEMFERLLRNGAQRQIDVQRLLELPLKPKVTRKSLRSVGKGEERRMLDIIQGMGGDFACPAEDDRQ